MGKNRRLRKQRRTIALTIVGLLALTALTGFMLRGADIALLQPKGLIAGEQFRLLVYLTVLLVGIAVPTLLILYFIVWRYQDDKVGKTYEPSTKHHNKSLVAILWTIPCIIALLVLMMLWPATHRLEPRKTISESSEPLTIQVVAMRWKWLFIYPEQDIASVNFVQIPVNTPVRFEITADEAPMSSFWIPHLGGQLYAMTGHVNQLNLLADVEGDYPGSTPEINGKGFAGMRFVARASSTENFESWVQSVKQSAFKLNNEEYQKLVKPSENNSQVLYASTDKNLYGNMLMKYYGSHAHSSENKEYEAH